MFEKYGGFRTDLGRRGLRLISNEDSEFGRRLLAAGERLRYEPAAVVYHPVTADRLRKNYFLAWWFGKGRTDVREFGIPPDTKWRLAGIPLVQFRRIAFRTLLWILTRDAARRFSYKLQAWTLAGEIVEAYRQARISPAGPENTGTPGAKVKSPSKFVIQM